MIIKDKKWVMTTFDEFIKSIIIIAQDATITQQSKFDTISVLVQERIDEHMHCETCA